MNSYRHKAGALAIGAAAFITGGFILWVSFFQPIWIATEKLVRGWFG